MLLEKGKQVAGFGALRDDGTTACGCWIYSGCFNEAGNNMARRDNSDPDDTGALSELGVLLAGQPPHPLQPRLGRHRTARPGIRRRKLIEWDGAKWAGYDVPDIAPTAKPDEVGPFIMNPEGVVAPVHPGHDARRAVPGRITSRSSRRSPMPIAPKVRGNPGRAGVQGRHGAVRRRPTEFPYAATSYRLTEHFHFWTKHVQLNAVMQPEFFVEISEQLAKEKGITPGGWVRVWSKRGSVKAKAVVTKRIKPLTCDGKTVHIVGIPLHWGFTGAAQEGLRPELADALCRRRQHRDAGVQGVPGRYRAHPRAGGIGEASMAIQPIPNPSTPDIAPQLRRAGSHPPLGLDGARRRRGSSTEVAKLIDVSKCIGCKACQVGLPRVERHCARKSASTTGSTTTRTT